MKKFIFILLIAHCSLLIVEAQQPTEEWVRRFSGFQNYGSNGLSVKLDSAGNVYVLAGVATDTTFGDFGALKYNPAGKLIWSSFYNSPSNLSDQNNAFAVSSAGDVYITGRSGINFTNHITTIKFSSNGVLQWAKVFDGGSGDDNALDIALDRTGDIIIIGYTRIGNIVASLTIKYASNGDSLWVRKFTQVSNSNNNYRVVIDDSNNVYSVGDTPNDYLMLKYNSSGNLQWYATYDSPQHYIDLGWAIDIDLNRNVYVVGTNSVPGSLNNNTLVNLNGNGSIQWDRVFTGISGIYGSCQIPAGIKVESNGDFVYYTTFCFNGFAGAQYEIVTLKYNSYGDTQWTRKYSGGTVNSNEPASLKLDKFNNIYITGYANYQSTGDDYVTLKYLPSGFQQWVASYNGPLTNSFDYAHDLVIDTSLNVYVTGISSRFNGNPILWDAATIKYDQPIGIISNGNELPVQFKLFQNYPNPFNITTVINYELPRESIIELELYNEIGQLVKTLVRGKRSAGYYSLAVNCENYSSGVYFYRIEADDLSGKKFIDAKKMILVK